MLPRQFYLHAQLRLPSLYFSRVSHIFQDAAVSRPVLQRIIDACEATGTESAQYRMAGTVFAVSGGLGTARMSRLPWLGSSCRLRVSLRRL
jgi:hypothetical protein